MAEQAALMGYRDIVMDLIRRGADDYEEFYDDIAEAAAEGGHLDIIDKMLELGGGNYQAMAETAAEHGHLDIVKFIVETNPGYVELNSVEERAEEGGHQHIVKWLSELETTTL